MEWPGTHGQPTDMREEKGKVRLDRTEECYRKSDISFLAGCQDLPG